MTNEFDKIQAERWGDLNNMLNLRFTNVDVQLFGVNKHLETLNGKVVKHADDIYQLNLKNVEHYKLCPVIPELKTLVERVNELENGKKINIGIKHIIISIVSIMSVILGIFFTSFKIQDEMRQKETNKIESLIIYRDSIQSVTNQQILNNSKSNKDFNLNEKIKK